MSFIGFCIFGFVCFMLGWIIGAMWGMGNWD